METGQQYDKIAAALIKAQGEIKNVVKDKENPFYKAKYAGLDSVVAACKEALLKNGIAFIQTTNVTDKGPVLVTTLLHVSGQFVSGFYPLVTAKKDDPQALGSATTYARRYALAAMVGICSEDDDDAESATQRQTATGKPASTTGTGAAMRPPLSPRA